MTGRSIAGASLLVGTFGISWFWASFGWFGDLVRALVG
jgi:hypothetical protein